MTNLDECDSDPLTQMEVDAAMIRDGEESEQEHILDSIGKEEEWIPSTEESPSPRTFDLNGPTTTMIEDAPNIVIDEEDQIQETGTAELLRHHHDMGHISFAKLQVMGRQ